MADEIRATLSKRLKSLMCETVPRVTAADLAKALNLSTPSISMYTSGGSSPTLATLVGIAKYFNTSADYLLGLTDVPHPLEDTESKADETTDESAEPWKQKSICKNCKWRTRVEAANEKWDGTVCAYTLETGNFRETAVTDTHCDYFKAKGARKDAQKAESYPLS